MNGAEKFLLVVFIYAIVTCWAAEAGLDSLNIPGGVWWAVAIVAAGLFIIWPKGG